MYFSLWSYKRAKNSPGVIGYNDKNNANKNITAVDAWISSSAAVMLVCAVNQYTIGNGGASTASSDKYKKGRIFYTRSS